MSGRLDLQTDQAEKYAYAVLGAGRQGTAAAYDMAKFGHASKVTIGDIDLRQARRAANHVNRLIGRRVAEGVRVDVRRRAQVKRFLTGVDAFLSAVPHYYNLEIAKAAIGARANMCVKLCDLPIPILFLAMLRFVDDQSARCCRVPRLGGVRV